MKTAIVSSEESTLRYNESKASVVILEEDGRTRYVPPEPTVKILKRPQSTGSSHLASGDNVVMNGDATKPRQPVKTLQQRELEYAEARLRILGEARSPEENSPFEERIQKIQNRIELLRPSENENIVRLPRGPDGTRGFNLRR